MVSQISTIDFGILGDDDIVNMAVCLIDNPSLNGESGSVYDPRLGCIQNNSKCATCLENIWICSGHFGYIDLNVPIILFYKQCVPILKCFCFECHRLLCTEEELKLNSISGYDRTLDFVSKMTSCIRCKTPHPEIRLNVADSILTRQHKYKNSKASSELTPAIIKAVFDNVLDEDVKLLGINPKLFHPRNLVLTKFLVIPTCCRPRMITPSTASDDDITLLLIDIIKNNNAIANMDHRIIYKNDPISDNSTKTEAYKKSLALYEKAVAAIKFKTLAHCDNSKGKATHNTNHKALQGLKERLVKKNGLIRQHMSAKRNDNTARTVVGPDPTLKLDEVAIPIEIAKILTVSEYVNPLTIEKLTRDVNNGIGLSIEKPNGTKINVSYAILKKGYQLMHGDIIRSSDGITEKRVTDTKIQLKEGETIYRDGKLIEIKESEKREIKLEYGDKVERSLKDGDPVMMNRQPTLHRFSMQGMRVKLRKCKSFRFNVAMTTPYNMDFDGDEGNLYNPTTLESKSELLYLINAKKNLLSAQTNKSEIVIIQDSLLGAYKMTEKIRYMDKEDFFNCIMRTSAFERYPNWQIRLEEIRKRRNEDTKYTAHGLFGFILPHDFHVKYTELNISYGVVTEGYFDKNVLKGSANSIIRLLCLEYGEECAATFIDDIQFLTNAWLEINPFSVGVEDCLIGSEEKSKEIKDTIHKFFMEADQVRNTTDIKHIKESRITCSLNKAKDIGLRIAKEALKPNNNFISTVVSGSKGDYFNIAQITGLLGQQNLSGGRPIPTLDNKQRTLPHYPRVIIDRDQKYESRGFVASSFIGGMNPKEMFFHAMAGREGMISTAMGTAASGYVQRCCVKLNEDLKVAYDGTVRDANQNIYQYAYGNEGFDPSLVTYTSDKKVLPVNIERLSNKLSNEECKREKLFEDEIEEIIRRSEWKCQIPKEIHNLIWGRHEKTLREELETITVDRSKIKELSEFIIQKYHTTRATPGDCVGIIGAQSIGERQTQTNLNTFHTAGKLQTNDVGRFEEILYMAKNIKVKTCVIYFKEKYNSSDELRKAVGSSIVGVKLSDIIIGKTTTLIDDVTSEYPIAVFKYELNPKIMYSNRISPDEIVKAITTTVNGYEGTFSSTSCTFTCKYEGLRIKRKPHPSALNESIESNDSNDDQPTMTINEENDMTDALETIRSELESNYICGIEGIKAMYLDHDGIEWYLVTEGLNLPKLLSHDLIDVTRLYCNDIWAVYECLGISAARRLIFDDIKKVVRGVNDCHIKLLVDKMTAKGRPKSYTRYSMRTNEVGALSKATFEESIDIIINAAVKTEQENMNGVSAAVISGNQARIGTGMMGLKPDYERIINGYDNKKLLPIEEEEIPIAMY